MGTTCLRTTCEREGKGEERSDEGTEREEERTERIPSPPTRRSTTVENPSSKVSLTSFVASVSTETRRFFKWIRSAGAALRRACWRRWRGVRT
jgi:hypothetical protein